VPKPLARRSAEGRAIEEQIAGRGGLRAAMQDAELYSGEQGTADRGRRGRTHLHRPIQAARALRAIEEQTAGRGALRAAMQDGELYPGEQGEVDLS
jgi:hypothetical protein